MRFEQGEEVGRGASSRVFEGTLQEPCGGLPAGARVAIKRPRPELAGSPELEAAYRAEAEVGREVSHPGLACALAAGRDREGPWLVLPWVGGQTLHDRLVQDGPLPEPRLRAAFAQVADGLAALHEAGWVHGDIKPENVRLDSSGRGVLVDFGFACRQTARPERGAPGSLAYLSPEQARGSRASTKSDLFALGVTLYELATGAHPFTQAATGPDSETGFSSTTSPARALSATGGDTLLASVVLGRFTPPSRRVPQLSPFLDALIAETLARRPSDRPDARALATRLTQGEESAWWRDLIELGPAARRGGRGDDAQHLTPRVGRERELAALERALADVGSGPGCRVVWLEGATGSGKSRLASDFASAARASPDPPLYLYARCPPHAGRRPCAPLVRLLHRYLRIPPGSALGQREKDELARLVPPAEAEALVRALGSRTEVELPASLPGALAAWLAGLAQRQRAIVFLDDLNYADAGTLAALAEAAPRLVDGQVLLVLGLRTDDEVAHPEALDRLRGAIVEPRTVRLEPLPESAVRALVERMFHPTSPRLRIAEVLWSRSRGNPGLLAELLRDLQARGELDEHSPGDPRFVLAIPPEEIPLPRSLPDLVAERWSRLPAADRAWVARLAVVGGRIDPEFLERAFPPSTRPEIDELLARLVRLGWLVPAGARYRFARPALREAVYLAIPPSRRRRLHAAAARALRAEPGQGLPIDDAFQRAFHLRAAGDNETLLRVLRPLLAATLRRGQPHRAHTLAGWGLDALEESAGSPEDRLALLEIAADAADRLGIRTQERRWLDQLAELVPDDEHEPARACRVYLLHGRYGVATGQYGLARGMYKNAVALAERAGEDELASEALRRLAAVQAHVGDYEDAERLAREAIRRAVHGPQRAVARLQLGIVAVLTDRLEEALVCADRALDEMRRARDRTLPGILAAAHMLRGRAYRLLGRPRRAVGSLRRALRLARRAGERRLQIEISARLGALLVEIGRTEEAESRLRDARLAAGEIEDRRGLALAGLWLGILLLEDDRPEARRVIARAAEQAAEIGLYRAEALARAILARAELARGRTLDAERLSAQAVELLEAHGAELADRIVIEATRILVEGALGRDVTAAERRLARRLARGVQSVRDKNLRRRHRWATEKLLAGALTIEGPIYPRVQVELASEE